jgi:hypothetical protein
MGELPKIEAWRAGLDPARAAIFNHPQSVWRHFACGRPGSRRGRGSEWLDLSSEAAIAASAAELLRRYGETVAIAALR